MAAAAESGLDDVNPTTFGTLDPTASTNADDAAVETGLPDSTAPQDTLRRFELTACALLANTSHLRAALLSGRRKAAPARGDTLTPLEAACQAGRLANVKLLLKEAPGTAASEEPGESRPERAVALAVEAGASDVVCQLIKSRAQVNAREACERPPLLTAVRDGYVSIVEALCECPDTDINAQDARGATAVHEAVCRGSSQLLTALIMSRANAAIADARGWTPLHLAAHFGNVDAMARLLQAGAPIDGTSISTSDESVEIAASGVEGGASERAAVALSSGTVDDTAIAKSVSEIGGGTPDVVADDADKPPKLPAAGWAPLHLLIGRGNQETAVRQLISWRADACRSGGHDGMTPLMLAISLNQEAVALLLLSHQEVADCIDVQDRRGRSALHFAVAVRSEPVVRGLLEVHASPSLKSEVGMTPIDVARSAGIPESSGVVKRLQVEEIARLVMQRQRCRAQNKYEEAELLRGDLRLRGVSLDVQNEKWTLPDGTWGYLSTDRNKAQSQGGPSVA